LWFGLGNYKIIKVTTINSLKAVWEKLVIKYTTDLSLIEKLWRELEVSYTSAVRHYHNFDHINFMLNLAEQHYQLINQQDLLIFAIFYHDVVYKATRSDNEEKSASLAVKMLQQLGLSSEATSQVYNMILATKNHVESSSSDTNLLIDFDLAILGSDWESYQNYTQQIRKEYSFYPTILYRPGRAKVLTHFLQQPYIYKTNAFRETLELKARDNLKKELSTLR
jgi:predicted metal-dependent HD superfamily phosphohydrolase